MGGKIAGVQPSSWQDFAFWLLLKLFWEPFSRKKSHWWHWRQYQRSIQQIVRVPGDSQLNPRHWQHKVFWGTNFAWQQVVVLRAKTPVVYQVGFRNQNICQLCSLLLIGEVALTIGPEDTNFFGITADGQDVELEEVCRTTRQQLSNKIPLL